jgi:predicted DNA-binding transcriptional regulator AlpA
MPKFIRIETILVLFKKYLEINISRSNVYFYIRYKGFPASTGFGCPRQWDSVKVEKWFKAQRKK